MVANLDNFYGRLDRVPEAVREPEEFPYEGYFALKTPLDGWGAEQVGQAYAEARWHSWESPNAFDLLIWELLDDDATPPAQVFRVRIDVRMAPEFHDSSSSVLTVPTGEVNRE